MTRLLIVLSMAATATGCCHDRQLYTVSNKENGGVPFYVLEQYNVGTSAFDETFYKIEVKAVVKEGPPKPPPPKPAPEETPAVRSVVAYTRDLAAAQAIYGTFLKAKTFADAWSVTTKSLLTKSTQKSPSDFSFAPFPQLTTPTEIAHLPLIGTSTTRIQIPSSDRKYFNLTVPYGGLASGQIELNSDGTLGKAVSEKEDKLPGAIAAAAGQIVGAGLTGPGASIATHFFPSASAPAEGAVKETGELVYTNAELAISPVTRIYTVALAAKAGTDSCKDWRSQPRFDSNSECWVTVTAAIRSEEPGKKDENAVTFSGSVSLPKPDKAGK